MEPSPLFTDDPARRPKRLEAGIISRIHLENFMCHSNLDIEFGDLVNFITGQNGSGKSAILTALCVAFGCRARGTQRANTLKDFIKTGCSSALVQVEIKNQGEDAFKHELYGDTITVERRISESAGGSITLKNSQGRKIGSKRDDLREIVEYFNIDVENPCTTMTQDKSREFLHSGNDKDKFKFYFKATLLQQVDDLLSGIDKQLQDANGLISHLEDSLRPAKKELDELQEKIKNMEIMEEMSQQVQLLRKKLAWSWVYDADRKLDVQHTLIEKLKGRIPSCQAMIDQNHHKMEKLNDRLAAKKDEISNMMERTSEVRRLKEDLQQNLSMAVKEQLELTGEQERINRQIDNMVKQVRSLERQIQEMHEQYQQNTQVTHLLRYDIHTNWPFKTDIGETN
ncbi:structural maintenance of chromosomes protein 6A-like [Salvia splendens]|uniref:structural maintenance of chromosomes protein 6A-like n=1 Tax=Salvia splendens TaxID=180675 RepID=UPI001C272233|nr:structural maintenance of chromosomes protein 6A-like [Salvia splendens]